LFAPSLGSIANNRRKTRARIQVIKNLLLRGASEGYSFGAMFPTDDVSLVLAALPHFRIQSREDYVMAGAMLETLLSHLPHLTPQQREQAQELASMVSRYSLREETAGSESRF
jgi:hypothetical protein